MTHHNKNATATLLNSFYNTVKHLSELYSLIFTRVQRISAIHLPYVYKFTVTDRPRFWSIVETVDTVEMFLYARV